MLGMTDFAKDLTVLPKIVGVGRSHSEMRDTFPVDNTHMDLARPANVSLYKLKSMCD